MNSESKAIGKMVGKSSVMKQSWGEREIVALGNITYSKIIMLSVKPIITYQQLFC